MKISDLVGSTTLSGFDRMIESRPVYEGADTFVDAEVVHVILGGTTYEFAENPADGYRSSCEDPIVSKIRVQNTFAPVPVLCTWSTDASFRYARGDGDFLTIRNASTSATILVIGTDDIDDYYPSFICDFSAEAIGEIQETLREYIHMPQQTFEPPTPDAIARRMAFYLQELIAASEACHLRRDAMLLADAQSFLATAPVQALLEGRK